MATDTHTDTAKAYVAQWDDDERGAYRTMLDVTTFTRLTDAVAPAPAAPVSASPPPPHPSDGDVEMSDPMEPVDGYYEDDDDNDEFADRDGDAMEDEAAETHPVVPDDVDVSGEARHAKFMYT